MNCQSDQRHLHGIAISLGGLGGFEWDFASCLTMRIALCKNRRKDCCCCCCRFVIVIRNWLHDVNVACLDSADDPAESAELFQPFLVATTSIRLAKMQQPDAVALPADKVTDHWLRRQSCRPQVITAQLSDSHDQISIVDSVDSIIEEPKVIRRRRKRLMKMTRPPRRSFPIGFGRLGQCCGI